MDIKKLCESYLHAIGHLVGDKAALKNVYYFSALAHHLEETDPDITIRHKSFIKILKDTDIFVELGRFKAKEIKCRLCQNEFVKHEEKETDVAIALKLLEVFITDECDTVILVSGDTDLAPAIRTARQLFPKKHVLFAFPYLRKNKELAKLAPGSFVIKPKKYVKFQLPDPYNLSDGTQVKKPPNW